MGSPVSPPEALARRSERSQQYHLLSNHYPIASGRGHLVVPGRPARGTWISSAARSQLWLAAGSRFDPIVGKTCNHLPGTFSRFGILLPTEQTADAVGIVEVSVPPGWDGPPLHHHNFDESFYVLDGELTFQLGETLRTGVPGELVFAPRGAVHTLANLGERPARYLLPTRGVGWGCRGSCARSARRAGGRRL
jgi:quercetin dioxygenase-like cupin family protein